MPHFTIAKVPFSSNQSEKVEATPHSADGPVAAIRLLKRKYEDPEIAKLQEEEASAKVVLFQGRDESYPDELNLQIHPLSCDLCKAFFNSLHTAKEHYESKTHDRKIMKWLHTNYTEKGLEPPHVKRLYVHSLSCDFYCELCDVKLTSSVHASQHYAGRKHRHRLVTTGKSKHSGTGYSDTGDHCMFTGTKETPTKGRPSIAKQFKGKPPTSVDSTTGICSQDNMAMKTGRSEQDDSVHCKVCNISVSSASQMNLHFQGSKHHKNLKAYYSVTSQESAGYTKATFNSLKQTLQSFELSMYRTPTGLYYCQTCNASMLSVASLSEHLQGKKHLRNCNLKIGSK